MRKTIASLAIIKDLKYQRILIIPKIRNEIGIFQELKTFENVEYLISADNLGKQILSIIEKHKNSNKDNVHFAENKDIILKGYKTIKSYGQNVILTNISIHQEDENPPVYRILKMYSTSDGGFELKKSDPVHYIPIDSSAEEIGKTVLLAFDDISADGKVK